jgi:AcrR family transcriptional regulator
MATSSKTATDTPPPSIVGDGPRPMRADALKNRRRILEAAEETFAEQGVSVPIDLVAERAGVGVGTLYRHFPTKEALYEAVVLTRIDGLIAAATGYATAPDPGAALFAFLREFAREASMKRDLFEALGAAGIDLKAQCQDRFEQLEMGVDVLLQRAAATGDVRGDVTTKEVIGLVVGTCMATKPSGIASGQGDQMLQIVCDGLRASR